MKLKYEFETMEMDDQVVAVPVGDEAENALHGIIKLNDSAAAIFELLKKETTEDAIVAAMKKEYDAVEPKIREYVRGFIDYLDGQGLLEFGPGEASTKQKTVKGV